MNVDITDGVPGIGSERLAELAEEAEKGYDTHRLRWEPNLSFQSLKAIPEDLAADITSFPVAQHQTSDGREIQTNTPSTPSQSHT